MFEVRQLLRGEFPSIFIFQRSFPNVPAGSSTSRIVKSANLKRDANDDTVSEMGILQIGDISKQSLLFEARNLKLAVCFLIACKCFGTKCIPGTRMGIFRDKNHRQRERGTIMLMGIIIIIIIVL